MVYLFAGRLSLDYIAIVCQSSSNPHQSEANANVVGLPHREHSHICSNEISLPEGSPRSTRFCP